MSIGKSALIAFAIVAMVSAATAGRMSFEDYLNQATQCPGVATKDYPNFAVYICDDGTTYYIITKQNHPAYPGVIVRKVVDENGRAYMVTEGHSFVDDDKAFRDWMRNFSN